MITNSKIQSLIIGSSIWAIGLIGCGQTSPSEDVSINEPIINGDLAGAQAKSIQGVMLSSALRPYCGSVYLGTNGQGEAWMATAAHCVDPMSANDRFGFGGLAVSNYNAGNTVGWVEEVQHPGWNPSGSFANDIAVVRLASVPPNSQAVTLATSTTDAAPGEAVTISGYGYSTQPSFFCIVFGFGCPSAPPQLLEADTEVLSTNACRQTFNDVNNTQICIRDSGGQGACNGDSGGPMFRNNGTVVGLTSFGRGGCAPSSPQVYTRISAYRSWIADVTGI